MDKNNVFVVKGGAPWYSTHWEDKYHVISRDKRTRGQAIITCDNRVKSVQAMFGVCRNLTSIDLSGFDTSKVIDMSNMFIRILSLRLVQMCSLWTGAILLTVGIQIVISICMS